MVKKVLGKSLSTLAKYPARLWGITFLCSLVRLGVVALGILVPIISLPVSLVIATGLSVVYLNGYTGIAPTSAQLFEGLKKENALRVAGGSCWLALWKLIWLCIPVVNIIKSLQYSFTPYILMKRPDISATEALRVSIAETRGYKWKMFLAQILIAVIVSVISGLLTALGMIPSVGTVFQIVLLVFSAAVYLFMPILTGIIKAGFYEEAQKAVTKAR